jgi:hypothetical protein
MTSNAAIEWLRQRGGRVAAGSVLAVGIAVGSAAVAPTADAAPADPPMQSSMGTWSDGAVWQTSTGWGRVRERVGFEWTVNAPYQVRAVTQVHVDWPSDCKTNVEISKDPKLGLEGCSNKWWFKSQSLKLRSMTVPMSWTGPSGSGKHTCDWGALTASAPKAQNWTCRGEWMKLVNSQPYRVAVDTINGDVRDDGDGLKPLAGRSATLRFIPR